MSIPCSEENQEVILLSSNSSSDHNSEVIEFNTTTSTCYVTAAPTNMNTNKSSFPIQESNPEECHMKSSDHPPSASMVEMPSAEVPKVAIPPPPPPPPVSPSIPYFNMHKPQQNMSSVESLTITDDKEEVGFDADSSSDMEEPIQESVQEIPSEHFSLCN